MSKPKVMVIGGRPVVVMMPDTVEWHNRLYNPGKVVIPASPGYNRRQRRLLGRRAARRRIDNG